MSPIVFASEVWPIGYLIHTENCYAHYRSKSLRKFDRLVIDSVDTPMFDNFASRFLKQHAGY